MQDGILVHFYGSLLIGSIYVLHSVTETYYLVFFWDVENATPINFEITMKRNVREQKIRERGVNHENHENIMPRKFGAIRYVLHSVTEKSSTHCIFV